MNRFLSQAGIAARRKSDRLIKDGQVSVNGRITLEPGYKVKQDEDEIRFRGTAVYLKRKHTYILLNKPRGVVCTVRDDMKRTTVTDLIKIDSRIFPVGRLDITTTGLILLTDDGDMSYRLSHPKFEVNKVYRVGIHRKLQQSDITLLESGIEIGKREKVSAQVRALSSTGLYVTLTVHEGRKNMIKRMFDMVGYKVTSLDRIAFAGLTKRKLPRGGWRYLTGMEIDKLYHDIG